MTSPAWNKYCFNQFRDPKKLSTESGSDLEVVGTERDTHSRADAFAAGLPQ
jgi:hypothetical protein